MPEPSPFDLERDLALLKQLVESGFRSLETVIKNSDRTHGERIDGLKSDIIEVKVTAGGNAKRLDAIEPTVKWIERAFEVIWKLAVIAAFGGIAWAIVQAGALP